MGTSCCSTSGTECPGSPRDVVPAALSKWAKTYSTREEMKLEGKREEEGSVDKLTLQTLIDRMHHHTICILLTSKAQKQTAPLMEAVRMQRHIHSLGDSHPS